MRRFVIAVAIALTAASAFAADDGKTQLSVFTSALTYSTSRSDGTFSRSTGGLGLAIAHSFTPHWAVELKVAQERHDIGLIVANPVDPSAQASIGFRRFHTVPVDLLAQYRFPNSSRWTPYVTAGLHHLFAPTIYSTSPIWQREEVGSWTTGELGGGTDVRFTPHLGMRFDLNLLLHNRDYDSFFRPSIGLNWRF